MRVLALSSAQLPAGFSLDGGGSPLAPPYPWMTLPLQDVGFYLSDGSHSCADARRKSPTPSIPTARRAGCVPPQTRQRTSTHSVRHDLQARNVRRVPALALP